MRCLLALITFLAASTPAAGQTTHLVDMLGGPFIFVPDNLTIEVGDTVRWTWATGLHNVESGVGGTHDGNFSSGAPINSPGFTFDVTFDQAFLMANPMPGNSYPYYCIVHEAFGQAGTVTVDQSEPFGLCNSTPGSLLLLSGSPDLGTAFSLGVHDPVGSVPSGSITALLISVFPDAAYPCGTPLPGLGMTGPSGDLLVNLLPPDPAAILIGPAWAGAPASILVPVPNDPVLTGVTIYAQGALTGLGPSRLTEGQALSIGLP